LTPGRVTPPPGPRPPPGTGPTRMRMGVRRVNNLYIYAAEA